MSSLQLSTILTTVLRYDQKRTSRLVRTNEIRVGRLPTSGPRTRMCRNSIFAIHNGNHFGLATLPNGDEGSQSVVRFFRCWGRQRRVAVLAPRSIHSIRFRGGLHNCHARSMSHFLSGIRRRLQSSSTRTRRLHGRVTSLATRGRGLRSRLGDFRTSNRVLGDTLVGTRHVNRGIVHRTGRGTRRVVRHTGLHNSSVVHSTGRLLRGTGSHTSRVRGRTGRGHLTRRHRCSHIHLRIAHFGSSILGLCHDRIRSLDHLPRFRGRATTRSTRRTRPTTRRDRPTTTTRPRTTSIRRPRTRPTRPTRRSTRPTTIIRGSSSGTTSDDRSF